MNQEKLLVRWHSRAGQGAVTAANFFAESLHKMGYKTQAFPAFGAEKRGAPVVVYNRVMKTDKVLDDPAHLRHLNLVILLDPTLVGNELTYQDILEGLEDDGTLVINTSKRTASGFRTRFPGNIFHLNATKIAQETIGRNIPNVAMIGGLVSVLGLDETEMTSILKSHLRKNFPDTIVENNMRGFKRGTEEVFMIDK